MSTTHPPTPTVRGRRSLPLVVLVCGLLHSALVWADNSIDAVAVSRGTAGRTVIKMTLKEPIAAAPAGFSISNPPRIALDFPNTGNGTGKAVQEVGDAVLRSLNIVQAGTRTRVVLNLVKTQNFETQLSGRDLFITLFDQPTGDQAGAATVSHFSEAKGAEPGALSLRTSISAAGSAARGASSSSSRARTRESTYASKASS